MKWTATKLIAVGGLAAARLVLSLLGAAVVAITGIPGSGGVITVFVAGVILIFACLLIKRFGTATILTLIYSILVMPLPLGGTPGFLPKILIITTAGFVVDCIFILFRKNEKFAALMAGGILSLVEGFAMILLGKIFSLPGIEKFTQLFLSPIIVLATFIAGAFAGFIGYLIYKKLENTALVKRIQI